MCREGDRKLKGKRERERRRGPFSWTGMNEMLLNIHFYSPPTLLRRRQDAVQGPAVAARARPIEPPRFFY